MEQINTFSTFLLYTVHNERLSVSLYITKNTLNLLCKATLKCGDGKKMF